MSKDVWWCETVSHWVTTWKSIFPVWYFFSTAGIQIYISPFIITFYNYIHQNSMKKVFSEMVGLAVMIKHILYFSTSIDFIGLKFSINIFSLSCKSSRLINWYILPTYLKLSMMKRKVQMYSLILLSISWKMKIFSLRTLIIQESIHNVN